MIPAVVMAAPGPPRVPCGEWLDQVADLVLQQGLELRFERATSAEAHHVTNLHRRGVTAADAAAHLVRSFPRLFEARRSA